MHPEGVLDMKMMVIRSVVAFAIIAAFSVPLASVTAQLFPGDLILCYQDTSTTNAGGRTLRLALTVGRVTTLIDKLTTNPSWVGNWIQMAPDNRSVWVAYTDLTGAGIMYAIDRSGGVSTVSTLAWRTDGFRITDDGGITWSAYGGNPPRTNTLIRTDRPGFQNVTTLVSNLPSISLCHQEIEDTGNYVCSSQSTTAGQGGVSEVDPIRNVIVTTIGGMTLANTVDYHKGSGKVLVTEFGTPSNQSAQVGSLFAVDLGRRKYTTLLDANGPLGPTVDRLNWIECRSDNTVFLGARHKVFQFDLMRQTIVKTWTFEANRTQAITGATQYGNRPLTLDNRQARPGGSVTINLSFPHSQAALATYILGASFSLRPGLLVPGGQVVDLAPDVLFGAVVSGALSPLFRNFLGSLSTNGQATAQVLIPGDQHLRGIRLFVGGVAVISGQVVPINSEGFTIR